MKRMRLALEILADNSFILLQNDWNKRTVLIVAEAIKVLLEHSFTTYQVREILCQLEQTQCNHAEIKTEVMPWAHAIIKLCTECDEISTEIIEPANEVQ
jgi:hypothetical protein